MKNRLLLLLSAAMLSTSLMAGGIMTNTNQSAAYVRSLSRNASIGIDAVYYNPAGLMKLDNGFHFSLNNQSIFQTKDVVNNYPYLHGTPDAKYTGTVKAPFFPGIYAAYKMDKFAFSFGFNPVGGGGGAVYDKGLPSFEMGISDLVPSLKSTAGVTDYQAAINFEGSSVFFGYQAGVSFEINEVFSVFAGLRYVTAKNTYKGAIKDIMINPLIPNTTFNGGFVRADDFGTQRAAYYTSVAQSFSGAAAGAGTLAENGAGAITFAQAEAGGFINATQLAQFEGALTAAGQPTSTPIAQAQVIFTTVAAQANGGAAQMAGLAAKTGDKEVDADQTGTGYTPIIGANITLNKLTLAVKYEFMTELKLTNKTIVDGTGSFIDGEVSHSDMPAMLSIGAAYPFTEKLRFSASYNYYFDKTADYGKKDKLGIAVENKTVIADNFFEIGGSLEYDVTDKFLVSGGFLHANTGVTNDYQSDLSYSLTSNSVGIGGQYKITPNIAANLGALITMYQKDDRKFVIKSQEVVENLSKSTWVLGVGVDVKLGK